ncbi:MAG: hypothetical protein IJ232_01330 [Lachnospiraceae bacterium]|nr:hypothetical protein [Lachnospiraceae bacterium]
MRYDFLKDFPKRMKNVGLYATLIQNIVDKTSWNKYYVTKNDERINIVFSVLLFIMEKSLKDDVCTLDDVAVYIDEINSSDYEKPLSFDECREMADFIVNSVLSNDGKIMSFDGYDYEQKAYHIINIRYLMNKVVYIDGDVRRTSYTLTEEGYNLLLSTLEVEANLRFTIQEMIFRLHLEKQSYDKAAQDIRELFNQIRIQLRKIDAAMVSIRRNALNFSITQYEEITNENMDMVYDTKQKFENYRDLVEQRKAELLEIHFNVKKLSAEDEEKLANLKVISGYLGRTIDEHQKILTSHFNLKDLYAKEMDSLSVVSMVKRFSLRNEVYDKILDDPNALGNMSALLAPLFNRDLDEVYNPASAAGLQRTSRKKKEEDSTEDIEFDEELWEREKQARLRERRKKYEGCLTFILSRAVERGSVMLSEIEKEIAEEALKHNTEEWEAEKQPAKIDVLIPTIDIFKEIMVELIKGRILDLDELKKERQESFEDDGEVFEVNRMMLDIMERLDPDERVTHIVISKQGDSKVSFGNIYDEQGRLREIRCSDVKTEVF